MLKKECKKEIRKKLRGHKIFNYKNKYLIDNKWNRTKWYVDLYVKDLFSFIALYEKTKLNLFV